MLLFIDVISGEPTTINPTITARRMRVVRCVLRNSWHNLIGGTVGGASIPDSHYTTETLATELSDNGVTLTTGLPHKTTIKAATAKTINDPLKRLLGVEGITTTAQTVKWNIPGPYKLHCDLVRSHTGKGPSNIVAVFPATGKPWGLETYSPFELWHPIYGPCLDNITFTVKVDDVAVNFNGYKISLVLEFE